MSHEEITYSES